MSTPAISLTPAPDATAARRDMEMSMAVNNLKLGVKDRDSRDANGDGIPDGMQVMPAAAQAAQRMSVGAGNLGNDGAQRVAAVEGQARDGYSAPRKRTVSYRGTTGTGRKVST